MRKQQTIFSQERKQVALLVDPDKAAPRQLDVLALHANQSQVDLILVGGSLLVNGNMESCIGHLKSVTDIPVVIFPGNSMQVIPQADAILFLSLISGRNAEFLIGHHVVAAPAIKQSGINCIPTGYMLVGANGTSVQYMSNSHPIPATKSDIAMVTAMAGEMLGMQLIYMDAGSGAVNPISAQMIQQVKSAIEIPLIIGGGIRTSDQAQIAFEAGADCIVVGTVAEQNPNVLVEISEIKQLINRSLVKN
ncbi:MAG: geranylgeranylglyceryl/heptaprenylglyceryl phosphate synthase [Bacteroidota bacterium]|nr:geranylgeranylglyceryl/heptaprenylglyceryl phosphate synthase [Bacteroidota bacterium]